MTSGYAHPQVEPVVASGTEAAIGMGAVGSGGFAVAKEDPDVALDRFRRIVEENFAGRHGRSAPSGTAHRNAPASPEKSSSWPSPSSSSQWSPGKGNQPVSKVLTSRANQSRHVSLRSDSNGNPAAAQVFFRRRWRGKNLLGCYFKCGLAGICGVNVATIVSA